MYLGVHQAQSVHSGGAGSNTVGDPYVSLKSTCKYTKIDVQVDNITEIKYNNMCVYIEDSKKLEN